MFQVEEKSARLHQIEYLADTIHAFARPADDGSPGRQHNIEGGVRTDCAILRCQSWKRRLPGQSSAFFLAASIMGSENPRTRPPLRRIWQARPDRRCRRHIQDPEVGQISGGGVTDDSQQHVDLLCRQGDSAPHVFQENLAKSSGCQSVFVFHVESCISFPEPLKKHKLIQLPMVRSWRRIRPANTG